MKFLLDQNLSPKTTELFRELGFDALDVRELGMSGMPDDEIYRLAKEEGRILVTFDLDFARRFMAHKDLPGLVILRVHPQTLEVLHPILRNFFREVSLESLKGAIVTVESDRFRVRRVRGD